jgi:hypothetical protein
MVVAIAARSSCGRIKKETALRQQRATPRYAVLATGAVGKSDGVERAALIDLRLASPLCLTRVREGERDPTPELAEIVRQEDLQDGLEAHLR